VSWIIHRYSGMSAPPGATSGVFGSQTTGCYLPAQFAWTKIVRHPAPGTRHPAAGGRPPGDPALAGDWEQRRRRTRLPVDAATWHLLRRQHARCTVGGRIMGLRADRASGLSRHNVCCPLAERLAFRHVAGT
jgi:hypothetical protein